VRSTLQFGRLSAVDCRLWAINGKLEDQRPMGSDRAEKEQRQAIVAATAVGNGVQPPRGLDGREAVVKTTWTYSRRRLGGCTPFPTAPKTRSDRSSRVPQTLVGFTKDSDDR